MFNSEEPGCLTSPEGEGGNGASLMMKPHEGDVTLQMMKKHVPVLHSDNGEGAVSTMGFGVKNSCSSTSRPTATTSRAGACSRHVMPLFKLLKL